VTAPQESTSWTAPGIPLLLDVIVSGEGLDVGMTVVVYVRTGDHPTPPAIGRVTAIRLDRDGSRRATVTLPLRVEVRP
jgi:hypothetical protein